MCWYYPYIHILCIYSMIINRYQSKFVVAPFVLYQSGFVQDKGNSFQYHVIMSNLVISHVWQLTCDLLKRQVWNLTHSQSSNFRCPPEIKYIWHLGVGESLSSFLVEHFCNAHSKNRIYSLWQTLQLCRWAVWVKYYYVSAFALVFVFVFCFYLEGVYICYWYWCIYST